MSTNERDTHFQGAARLFVDDLQLKGFISRAEYETYVAQFAYDLVYFSFREMRHEISEVYDPLDALRDTPDMTEWPPT